MLSSQVKSGIRHCHLRLRRPHQPASAPLLPGAVSLLDRCRFYSSDGGGRDNNQKKKKPNFKKKFLDPAAKGELNNKHESGIPKLAARAKKPHLTPISSSGRGGRQKHPKLADVSYQQYSDEFESLFPDSEEEISGTDSRTDGSEEMKEALAYYAPNLSSNDKYYWIEDEFDDLADDIDISEFLDEDGNFEVDYDEDDLADTGREDLGERPYDIARLIDEMDSLGDEEEDEDEETENVFGKRRIGAATKIDPEQLYFYDQDDVMEIAATHTVDSFPDSLPDTSGVPQVAPFAETGPGVDDFLQSVIEHPTEWAVATRENLHPESKREPKPIFPPNRKHPPIDFVEEYSRFLYISGLPPLSVNGQPGNIDNAVDNDMLKRTIAGLLDVDSTRVFCASDTSGFVGYASPRELSDALERGLSDPFMEITPSISLYTGSEGPSFVAESSGSVVLIEDLPAGNTPSSIANKLFPKNTEVGEVYGDIEPEDVHFLSRSSVLIRMSSRDQAESAIHSSLVQFRLSEFGRYPIQIFRARRELVHAGYRGPGKLHEIRRVGPRLIVDGDMPSKNFHISHAGTVCLWNVDKSLSKNDINKIFQPFCELGRYDTSVEIVESENGVRTGKVYVGFDLPGEAEAFMSSHSGKVKLGDTIATAKLVRDRRAPGAPPLVLQKRPARQADELVDDLQNWEKHVDPADIEFLENHGVSREAIDDALVSIRYHNPTFGPLDSALSSESLYPNQQAGDSYKEVVQLYVQWLKKCIATPDDVGLMYEALHGPGEELDLEVFDMEKERQEKLRKLREGLTE